MVGDKTISENSEAPINDENVESTLNSKPQSEGRKHTVLGLQKGSRDGKPESILQEFVRLNDRLVRLNSGFRDVSSPILYQKRDIGQNLQAPVRGVDKGSESPKLVRSNTISERSEAETKNHERLENKLGNRELESALPGYTEISNKLVILCERYSAVSTHRISYRRKEDNDGCDVNEEALFGIISSIRAKRENSTNAIDDLRTQRKTLEDQNSILVSELEEAVHRADELHKAVESKKQSQTIVNNLKSKLSSLDKESSELNKNLSALKENQAVLQSQLKVKDVRYFLHGIEKDKKNSECLKVLEENLRKQEVISGKWMKKKNEYRVHLRKADAEELQKKRQFMPKANIYEKTISGIHDEIDFLKKSLLAENRTDEGIPDVEPLLEKLSACSQKLQMTEDILRKLHFQLSATRSSTLIPIILEYMD